MNFKQAVVSAFCKYATFEGRATRSEYWFFVLFTTIGNVVLQLLARLGDDPPNPFALGLLVVFALGIFLPSLAVCARRLHDTNRSGWWILLSLVPIVGIIVIVWVCQRGTLGTNRFGDDLIA